MVLVVLGVLVAAWRLDWIMTCGSAPTLKQPLFGAIPQKIVMTSAPFMPDPSRGCYQIMKSLCCSVSKPMQNWLGRGYALGFSRLNNYRHEIVAVAQVVQSEDGTGFKIDPSNTGCSQSAVIVSLPSTVVKIAFVEPPICFFSPSLSA